MRMFPTAVLLAALLSSACERKPATPMPAAPTTPAAPATTPPQQSSPPAVPPDAPGAATVTALGLNFTLPAGWKSVPPANPMRLAELQVPSPDPAKACTVTFSTARGEIQANINRWADQVRDASGQPAKHEVAARPIAGMTVHTTEMSGGFTPGMGDNTVREDWMLRGAIIETPRGLLFVKMTGPAEPMAAAGPAFNMMIESLKS